MSIRGVGVDSFQTDFHLKSQSKRGKGTAREAGKTNGNGSMSAGDFLNALKEQFPGVNFRVGKITPDNSGNFAFGGSGLHNLSVSDAYLSEMASTPEKRAEFSQRVENMVSLDQQYQAACEADGSKLVSHGIIIDSEGGMRGWSHTTFSGDDSGRGGFNLLGSAGKTKDKKSLFASYQELRERLAEKRAERKEAELRRQEKLEEKRLETELYRERMEKAEQEKAALQEEIIESQPDYNSGTLSPETGSVDKYV